MRPLACLLLIVTPLLHAGEGLTPLSESELAGINGQQGVLFNLGFRNNVDAANAPIGCNAVVNTPNPCRLGLEFAARAGKWLMLKEYYGTLHVRDLRMDAGFLPGSPSAYSNTSRFMDASGNCLLNGATGCSPVNQPAVLLSYPGTDAPAVYDDVLSFLNIGRVWIEFDDGATQGFARDTSLNSAFGVRMSDSSALNAAARMRFRGTGYVYGF